MDHIFAVVPILWILKILLLFMLKKSAYRIYFLSMSNHKAKSLMTDSNLSDKKGDL